MPFASNYKEACSGRGDCLNGTCLCEIRYTGDECTGFNIPYHAGKQNAVAFHILTA
jgi:hypothetical protein